MNNRNDIAFDAFQAEMMTSSVTDFVPLSSSLRCFYKALINDGFTSKQAMEFSVNYLNTLISVGIQSHRESFKNEQE